MSVAGEDVELWRSWRVDPSPLNTVNLLDQVQGLVGIALRPMRGVGATGGKKRVPPQVVDGKAQTLTLNILKGYDPQLGKLSNYLVDSLQKKMHAEINKYQNIVRIPHGKAEHVSKIKEAERDLLHEFGRVPSDEEIASRLSLPLKQVADVRFQSAQRDYLSSGAEIETTLKQDPYSRASRQTYVELPTQDRALYDLWMKQNKSGSEIMRMLNINRRQLQESQERIRSKLNENLAFMS